MTYKGYYSSLPIFRTKRWCSLHPMCVRSRPYGASGRPDTRAWCSTFAVGQWYRGARADDLLSGRLRRTVRNSVTAISGYADLLEAELDTEKHGAAVQTIREQADKLGELGSETRAIREPFHRRHAEHFIPVDAIEGFVETHREMHPDAVFDRCIDVAEETVVQNGSLLQLVIDVTLENTIVHNDRDEPRVEIGVAYVSDGAELCVAITDNGPGLPDGEWNALMAGEECLSPRVPRDSPVLPGHSKTATSWARTRRVGAPPGPVRVRSLSAAARSPTGFPAASRRRP